MDRGGSLPYPEQDPLDRLERIQAARLRRCTRRLTELQDLIESHAEEEAIEHQAARLCEELSLLIADVD